MVTERGQQDFYLDVHNAAETLQDEWETRYVPSPSSVGSCRLRQWFTASGIPRTNRIPVDSMKKMESGRVIEDFWRNVYTRAGFHVVSPTPKLVVGQMHSEGGDGIMYVADNTSLGLPRGAAVLLELKDFGAWSYCEFVKEGLQASSYDYWLQVQTYMHGFDLPFCVFHAGMADASGTKFIWRRIRKLGEEVPPFWIEVIKREPAAALEAITRAKDIRWAIDNSEEGRIPVELRDFDVHALLPKGGYPCGYCGWAEACAGADARPSMKIIGGSEHHDSERTD